MISSQRICWALLRKRCMSSLDLLEFGNVSPSQLPLSLTATSTVDHSHSYRHSHPMSSSPIATAAIPGTVPMSFLPWALPHLCPTSVSICFCFLATSMGRKWLLWHTASIRSVYLLGCRFHLFPFLVKLPSSVDPMPEPPPLEPPPLICNHDSPLL